jgi:acetoacetate decarboxylase
MINASVARRGVKVLEMRGEKESAEANPSPVFHRKTFNAGGMGQCFAIHPVWLLKPREVIHASYRAKVEISLKESEYDPIASMVAGDPISGRIAVTDILGVSYMFPVGIAGLGWLRKVFGMRIR